jgi:ATP-binding cassette subfamily B protein
MRFPVTAAALVDDLLRTLALNPSVYAVVRNPALGSVLIVYDPALVKDGAPLLPFLLRRLENGRIEDALAALPKLEPRPVAPYMSADGAAGLVLVAAGALLSLTVLPATFAVGIAVLGSSFIILQFYWQRSREARVGTALDISSPTHPMLRLLELNPQLRSRVLAASACSIGAKVLNTIPPIALGFTLSLLSGHSFAVITALGFATPMGQLLFIVGAGVACWCAESYLEYRAGLLWRTSAQAAQHDLRSRAYRHVQSLELDQLHRDQIGSLANVLNEDVNQIQVFFDTGAHDLLQLLTNVVLIAPLFYVVAPSVAWVAVLPIPLLIWLSFEYVQDTAPLHADVRRSAAVVNSRLVANLDGISVIKSFVTEDREAGRIDQLSLAYNESTDQTAIAAAEFAPAIRMTMLMTWAGTALVGGKQVLDGAIALGSYATIVPLARGFLWPLAYLGKTVDDYQRTLASLDRVFQLLDIESAQPGLNLPLSPERTLGDIEFEEVTFGYPERPDLLCNLSLQFRAGTMTGIVGVTGSGKTTILKLLLRFYQTGQGRVLLDGTDVLDFDVNDLRRAIGLVSQDPFLFEGSIADNIAYGNFAATPSQIAHAARLAELHTFIDALPDGYQTVVGERGVKLSGGQRQRICLARAILKDAPILLLDEATSAVDTETEAAIQRALQTVCRGRTTILVAHRLSTVRHADLIYVLGADGGIEESGTHAELLDHNSIYAAMWRVQTGDERFSLPVPGA